MKKIAIIVWGSLLLFVVLVLVLRYTPVGKALYSGERQLNVEDYESIVRQQNPGPFDKDYFESVVKQVKALGLKPGEKKSLSLDDLAKIHPTRQKAPKILGRGAGAGTIWAEMTVEGKLKVVIMTRDLGHAGEYGFAFSEVPLTPVPLGEGPWLRLDLPGHLNIVLSDMKIDDNWWRVLYNLD